MDTISAISTPTGQGGISIVRISGPDAFRLAQALFQPAKAKFPLPSHRMVLGNLIDPDRGTMVDQVLCCCMKSPFSYTREDVVEFHCHGSHTVARRVLTLTLDHGARLADPGEFTKRAFLAGRIDLSQAEAVAEIVQAAGEKEADLAASQLAGGIRQAAEELRKPLLQLLASLEVALDFPDEGGDILNPAEALAVIDGHLLPGVENLLASYQQGRIFREGLTVCLSGRPNVGKSSLMNALLQEDRAIVTAQPGTTRDLIHAQIQIRGLVMNLLDTAGLSENPLNEIDEESQRRARKSLLTSDLVLLVFDLSRPLGKEDLSLAGLGQVHNVLAVCNKDDLPAVWNPSDLKDFFPAERRIRISARQLTGLSDLRQRIIDILQLDLWPGGETVPAVVPNIRQKKVFEKVREACHRLRDALAQNLPYELIAFDIRTLLDHLGDITGKTTPEDVLDEIFSRFCLGK